jgi:hypothetical protein
MKRFFPFLPVLFLLPLAGCVGGSFGDTSSFEMFPLREASKSEARELKRCLKAAHAAQENSRNSTGHYLRSVKDLPVDNECGGVRLGQHGTRTGYEITGEIRGEESAVRWSVNEKGVIEEHLDPEAPADLEL